MDNGREQRNTQQDGSSGSEMPMLAVGAAARMVRDILGRVNGPHGGLGRPRLSAGTLWQQVARRMGALPTLGMPGSRPGSSVRTGAQGGAPVAPVQRRAAFRSPGMTLLHPRHRQAAEELVDETDPWEAQPWLTRRPSPQVSQASAPAPSTTQVAASLSMAPGVEDVIPYMPEPDLVDTYETETEAPTQTPTPSYVAQPGETVAAPIPQYAPTQDAPASPASPASVRAMEAPPVFVPPTVVRVEYEPGPAVMPPQPLVSQGLPSSSNRSLVPASDLLTRMTRTQEVEPVAEPARATTRTPRPAAPSRRPAATPTTDAAPVVPTTAPANVTTTLLTTTPAQAPTSVAAPVPVAATTPVQASGATRTEQVAAPITGSTTPAPAPMDMPLLVPPRRAQAETLAHEESVVEPERGPIGRFFDRVISALPLPEPLRRAFEPDRSPAAVEATPAPAPAAPVTFDVPREPAPASPIAASAPVAGQVAASAPASTTPVQAVAAAMEPTQVTPAAVSAPATAQEAIPVEVAGDVAGVQPIPASVAPATVAAQAVAAQGVAQSFSDAAQPANDAAQPETLQAEGVTSTGTQVVTRSTPIQAIETIEAAAANAVTTAAVVTAQAPRAGEAVNRGPQGLLSTLFGRRRASGAVEPAAPISASTPAQPAESTRPSMSLLRRPRTRSTEIAAEEATQQPNQLQPQQSQQPYQPQPQSQQPQSQQPQSAQPAATPARLPESTRAPSTYVGQAQVPAETQPQPEFTAATAANYVAAGSHMEHDGGTSERVEPSIATSASTTSASAASATPTPAERVDAAMQAATTTAVPVPVSPDVTPTLAPADTPSVASQVVPTIGAATTESALATPAQDATDDGWADDVSSDDGYFDADDAPAPSWQSSSVSGWRLSDRVLGGMSRMFRAPTRPAAGTSSPGMTFLSAPARRTRNENAAVNDEPLSPSDIDFPPAVLAPLNSRTVTAGLVSPMVVGLTSPSNSLVRSMEASEPIQMAYRAQPAPAFGQGTAPSLPSSTGSASTAFSAASAAGTVGASAASGVSGASASVQRAATTPTTPFTPAAAPRPFVPSSIRRTHLMRSPGRMSQALGNFFGDDADDEAAAQGGNLFEALDRMWGPAAPTNDMPLAVPFGSKNVTFDLGNGPYSQYDSGYESEADAWQGDTGSYADSYSQVAQPSAPTPVQTQPAAQFSHSDMPTVTDLQRMREIMSSYRESNPVLPNPSSRDSAESPNGHTPVADPMNFLAAFDRRGEARQRRGGTSFTRGVSRSVITEHVANVPNVPDEGGYDSGDSAEASDWAGVITSAVSEPASSTASTSSTSSSADSSSGVQGVLLSGEETTPAAAASSNQSSEEGGPSMDDLADNVYTIIRRKLVVERERGM